jgi:undecaprenyl-diphosphatase
MGGGISFVERTVSAPKWLTLPGKGCKETSTGKDSRKATSPVAFRFSFQEISEVTILQIIILAAVQGGAELLPVSSSAHVIVAAKLMGLDPTTPQMTLLLVMLHTGTMFAVIIFFWKAWRTSFFSSRQRFASICKLLMISTVITGLVGLGMKAVIERVAFGKAGKAEIEMLFGNLGLISAALAAVGVLITVAGFKAARADNDSRRLGLFEACGIGAVQGLCLPFRGFSRSGATISTGLLMGIGRQRLEEFSFALAVLLTPPVIAREVLRLVKAQAVPVAPGGHLLELFFPSLAGMLFSFFAGLLALRWLSSWLEKGLWHYFGIYCLVASAVVFTLYTMGM